MNLETELLDELKWFLPYTIKCGQVSCVNRNDDIVLDIELKVGGDVGVFLNELNFEYDPDNDSVYGIVWLTDGTWLEKCTIGCFKHWEHRFFREIPPELLP
jgi:hypothetical protein